MPYLNDELNWAEVGAIATGSGTVKDAFSTLSEPTKELLPDGMDLYKFAGNTYTVGRDGLYSPWWSPVDPFKHDGGLEQRIKIAKANGVTFREWGRLTSVIKEDWSSMKYLLVITLKEPVYAWFGGFKSMSRVDNIANSQRDVRTEARGRSANLPGGGTQFYIPALHPDHVGSAVVRPLP